MKKKKEAPGEYPRPVRRTQNVVCLWFIMVHFFSLTMVIIAFVSCFTVYKNFSVHYYLTIALKGQSYDSLCQMRKPTV